MNKIKKEFIGKRVVGAPKSALRVLSMWLMKKSRKVTSVNTNMKDECVSQPKTQQQLAQMDDDDDNVFATSVIDRYAARSPILGNMCLAKFAVNYNVTQAHDEFIDMQETNAHEQSEKEKYDSCTKIRLKDGLGYMQRRKQEAILRVTRYKMHTQPEKYYHSKLILFYPWTNEDDLITGFNSYMQSYIHKQDIIHENAQSFNEDCERFDSALEALENDVIPQSAWDSIVPTFADEDAMTHTQGFDTIQATTAEETDADTIPKKTDKNVQLDIDPLSKLYAKVAHKHMMTFQDYCSRMRSLNTKQHDIVMYNRAWCKSYIDSMGQGQKLHGYRVFLSGSGGTGKSHVLQLIQHDICYMLNHTINPDDGQTLVLVIAPTGSAAFQVGGSTIHSAFLLYDKSRTRPSWEKCSIMQLKLQNLILSITDEISMVSFKQYQQMNETMSIVKGTCDSNWGDICVLAVGDLVQYIYHHTQSTLLMTLHQMDGKT